MTMTRYEIRNVYSLADPELVKAADKDDPEALLEGVAMAGLVGVLRQLGDLAEFAAEIFHGLHEEVMTTAARGHGLLVRVQQLESDIPSIERAFLFETPHSAFFLNSGIDWHPDRQTQQNLITTGDSPRFVLDSYEECRGPPRLFLLDKFDVGGAGACLKRYTDPSVYKVEASSYENEIAAYQRDKRIRKTEKKGSRWKRGETSDVSHAKLHQLFLEERVQTGPIEPARRVKLKRRPQKSPLESESGESCVNKLLNSPLDSESGESCIKKLLNSPLDSGSGESGMKKLLKYQLEDKHVHAVPIGVSSLTLTSDIINESRLEVLDNIMGASLGSPMQSRSPCVSSNLQKAVCGGSTDTHQNIEIQEEVDEKQIAVGEEIKTDAHQNGFSSDDAASETDNYMDALATMDLDIETSINQGTCSDANKDQLRSQLPDSQFVDDFTASEDRNNSIRKRITVCVDSETSISTDITSPVGTESPPRPFACIEIPFRPRVPLVAEKIRKTEHPDGDVTKDIRNDVRKEPNVSSDIGSALKVDQVVILEEVTSHKRDSNAVSSNPNENLDSPRRSEDHQVDTRVTSECTSEQSECLPTAVHGLSAFSFVRNLKGDVDNKHPNVTSLPMIPLSNILDANKVEYAEKNHSTGSVVSQCSPTHAIISHVDEHPSDVRDVEVEPSETTFSDDVPLAEENAENPGMYPSPELQIREILDGILHESDSVEVTLPYSKVDETELNNSEIVVVTRAVFDHAVKEESELELEEIESVKLVSVPDNVDKNDGKNIEDDTELKRIEEDSNNSEMETSVVVLLPVDVDKNEDNGHSTFEDHSVINHLRIVQESTESGEHVEGNKLLVPSDTCDDLNNAVYVPDNDDKYDVKDLEYDTELKRIEEDSINLETETNAVVLLQVDIDNNEDKGHSTFEDHSVINQLCIVQESIDSGEHVEGNKLLVPSDTCDDVYVPDNVDKSDVKDLEDDTQLKGIEEDALKSEMETISVGLLPVDVSKSDNDGLSTFESHSVINQFCIVQESNESGEYGEVNKLLVPSDTCDDLNNVVYVPDNVDKYDGKDLEDDTDMKGVKDGPINSEMETNAVVLLPVDVGKNEGNGLSTFESHSATTLFCIVQKSNESGEHVEADKLLALSDTSDDLNNDVHIPSSNPKTLQGNSHSVLAERDEKQQVVLDDLGSQPVDTAPCDLSNVKLIDSTPKETVFAEADCTLESKSLEAKIDLSIDQIDIIEAVQSLPLEGKVDQPNGLLYAGGSQFSKLDSLNHLGTHTEPYQVKLTSQHLVQDDNQVIPIHQQGLQSTPESYSVPVSEKPPTMELRQPGSHDINLFDRAKRQSTPPFLGFGILPQIAPVKRVSMPPLPPLPPMQWRMRAPPTYGDRHSDDHFPSTFLSTTNVEPQVLGQIDEIRSLYAENQKSQHDVGRFSQMSSPESSLHIEDHHNSSVTSEAMVPQTDSCSIPTYEGKVFLPSPNTYSLPPVADKKPDNFLPVSPSTPNEYPEVVGHSTADEIGNLYTENQKSQYGKRSSSQMSLPTSSLLTEDHGNSSVSSEATGIQAAVEIEQYGSISTPSDQDLFSPSTNRYPLPPDANKMHDNITPIFPSTPVKDPQVVAHSTDQIRNLDTENQKSFGPMSLLESSVHTEDHDRPPVSSEAKFSENLVLQAAASTTSGQENISPSPNTYSSPPVIDEMQNNNRPMKIQRPRSPLIVAVAAHDKTQLRKVSDGATTQTPKGEEHDSILDQIRAKSFKLKPAVQTRPASIQGPRTNLRVAAILEKANAIRQAFAGSDDDDSDDWSD